ncbi:MAG: TldD protein [Thermoleophilaceae bacterium]|jgi:TldD protein|nr:TldD protein [Thermoleophilaceae bacterium]
MDSAGRRAEYADARFVRTQTERLSTRNGAIDQANSDDSEGVGVRVRVGGSWGFAATRGTDKADAEAALERALGVAAAQPPSSGAALTEEPPARGEYRSPAARDPFDVPVEDKLAILWAADAGLRTEPDVALTRTTFQAVRVHKLFASTEGALCEQVLTECGGGVAALAVRGDESQVRSYPASHGGHVGQAGYEHFITLDLPGEAPRVSAEAVALLTAPACPPGRTTLLLAGEQLGLQLHESVGHAVELDRVLGREASYAGTSFVPADAIGSLRFGSEHVSVTADATNPGGLGSFRWDDEGVEGHTVPIVRAGVLAGFLSSRETAAEIGLDRSGGCMRADGFSRQPIVRMTNVNLEPGAAGTLDDLVADTASGLLIETNRSWSIDDRRLHFQFEGEAAWEIRDGERGRLLRNPSYAGVTPRFWSGCDAVCSASEWRLDSLLDCGKGEPGQIMHVSHGSAPARFRDVEVGVA